MSVAPANDGFAGVHDAFRVSFSGGRCATGGQECFKSPSPTNDGFAGVEATKPQIRQIAIDPTNLPSLENAQQHRSGSHHSGRRRLGYPDRPLQRLAHSDDRLSVPGYARSAPLGRKRRRR